MHDVPSQFSVYSYDLFNLIIANLNLMLKLLSADQIEEINSVEEIITNGIKQVYLERFSYNRGELVNFCLEYQKLHEKIVTQINLIKSNIDQNSKNKKIIANKIYAYKKMDDLKY